MFEEAKDLAQLLEEEARLAGALLEIAGRKRKAIISGETERIAALSDEEEIAVAQLYATERARTEVTADLARRLDLPADARLDRFEAALEGEAGARLARAADALREGAKHLRRENRHNGELLAESLAHVAGFFRMLTGQATAEPALYAAEGAAAPPHALRLVDEQA